jgi:hypothetical protein
LISPEFILQEDAIWPGGKAAGKYSDFAEESRLLAGATIEAFEKISQSRPPILPRLVVRVGRKALSDERARAILEKAHELAAQRSIPVFQLSGDGEKRIFSYRVEKIQYEKMEREENLLVLGQVRVTSEIIPEPKEFIFGLIPSASEVFRTWISEKRDSLHFDVLKQKGREAFGKGGEEIAKVLTSLFGDQVFTMRDTFKEERQAIFQKLIQKEFEEHCQIYADLFDRTKLAVEALAREGLEIPYEIRVAAEVTLSDRLFQEIKELKRDFKGTVERRKIDEIVEEAKEHGYHLRKEKSLLALNEILMERMNALHKSKGSDPSCQSERAEEVLALLDLAKRWEFEISLEEAQNLMGEILDECVEALDKCWWGDGEGKPFHPNLITLAEKLGFNVEKFSKLAGPRNSAKRP